MPSSTIDTRARIAGAALRLLFERGLRGVTGQAVADIAGLSRMTVHRYSPSKQELLRAALSCVAKVFEEAVQTPEGGTADETIARLGEAIARLPAGDLPTRLAEVRNAFPDIHAQFLITRRKALDALLDRVFSEVKGGGRLRSDLDPRVMQVFIRESIANLLTPDQALLGLGVRPAEMFATVKEILLHGLVEHAPTPRVARHSRKGAKK
jgi:AcrR family transcriptional regulator